MIRRWVALGIAEAPKFGPVELLPGDNILASDTAEAPWREAGPRGRALSFSLQMFGPCHLIPLAKL